MVMENDDILGKIKKIANRINEKIKKTQKGEAISDFIVPASEAIDAMQAEFIPTNVEVLNQALGGGVPRRVVTTFHGAPGCGKTSVALSVAAELQKRGEYVLYLNTEGQFGMQANMVGLDKDKTMVISPQDYGEQLIDAVDQFLFDNETRLVNNLFGAVIVDSVNNLVPKAVIDKLEEVGSEGVTMARRAKLITDFLERLAGRGLLRRGCICILIVQDRANLSGYGPATQMSGGMAIKYQSHIIVNMGRKPIKTKVKGVEQVIGHTTAFEIEKNKVGGLTPKGEYSVIYGIGIDDADALVNKAKDWGYIVRPKDCKNRKALVVLLPEGDVWFNEGIAEIRDRAKADLTFKNAVKEVLDLGKPKVQPESVGKIAERFVIESVETTEGDIE
jgi:recombination protein RecA